MAKIKSVYLAVHPDFFNCWFEPARRKMERKYGKSLSQVKFTGLVANGIKIRKPSRNQFLPKELRRLKFYV